jgi:hypothetical protein
MQTDADHPMLRGSGYVDDLGSVEH